MKQIILIFSVLIIMVSCTDQKGESLFNGKDLSGWYTYVGKPDASVQCELPKDSTGKYIQPFGLNNDVLNVFTVVETDGKPAIKISGEVFGILVTEKEYENYHLSLEFKWGDKKYAPRLTRKKDSGVLYHSKGREGAWGGVWMKSNEFQVQESDLGDFIIVDTCEAVVPCVFDSASNSFHYDENGTPKIFKVRAGLCHKSADFEKPAGEWNTIEIYTTGGNSVHVVNGQVVLRAYDSKVLQNGEMIPNTRGKIQIQSEGAEIYYRNIRIKSITEFPANIGMELKDN